VRRLLEEALVESAPFEASEDTNFAVKVIDQRGNELMVVKTIGESARQ
jgi:hypothetical protein